MSASSSSSAHASTARAKLPRPLEGVRVLDCTRVLSGPICGRMLADLGADVIKIESPEPDILRSNPPHVGGLATMFAQYNVGKRNVSIDLKADGGPELLTRLAGEADVLVENFRPGVLTALGLGADALREVNPRLVYTSITGWGQEGPWASRPAYAPIVQAEAGTMALTQRLRNAPTRGEVFQHADLYAGLMACNATLSALFYRERSGLGQHLDVAMGESLLYVNDHASSELAGHPSSQGFATWDFESFELANGRSVHFLGSPLQLFPLLARCLPIPGVLDDPRFATPDARETNAAAAIQALREGLARVPSQADLETLLEGAPAMVAGVRTTRELADSDWASERGVLFEAAPGLDVPRAPFRSKELEIGATGFGDDGDELGAIAFRGEHNAEVLSEWVNASEQDVLEWLAAGVLQVSPDEPPSLAEVPGKLPRKREDH